MKLEELCLGRLIGAYGMPKHINKKIEWDALTNKNVSIGWYACEWIMNTFFYVEKNKNSDTV